MKTEDVRRLTGYSANYIRQWVYSGRCPFGSWVQFPNSSKKTLKYNEEAFWKWKRGELNYTKQTTSM